MLLTATLCAMMPLVLDDVVYKREVLGYSKEQYRAFVTEQNILDKELKIRTFGVVNLVYAMPKGSDYWPVRQQVLLTCNNEETIRGYQYPSERTGRRTRSGTGAQQHRGIGADEAWREDP